MTVRPVLFRIALGSTLAFAAAACGSGAGSTAAGGAGAEPDQPAPDQPGSAGPTPIQLRPGAHTTPSDPGVRASGGAPYPIVLMHGMAGFDQLEGPVGLTYFNGVVDDLAAHGEHLVFVTAAPPYDTSEDRAQAVAAQVQAILAQTGKDHVNLVGHSQGGMDARVMASPNGLGMGGVIASVTTIATPHHGSRVADATLGLLQNLPPGVVDQVTTAFLQLLQKTAYDVQSDPHLRAQVTELSEQYMETTFNPTYVDDTRVAYASYGGRTNFEDGQPDCASALYADDPSKLDAAQPELSATAQFLQGADMTTNDGLVTVASARWGTFLQCVPADHLAEVGQIGQAAPDPVSGFDHLAFFRDLVGRIRAAGF